MPDVLRPGPKRMPIITRGGEEETELKRKLLVLRPRAQANACASLCAHTVPASR